MKLRIRLAGTAVATLALLLSACGGDATDTPVPEETTTQGPTETTEPSEETTQDAPEPDDGDGGDAPSGDFPFEEGPVDPDEFTRIYTEAMTSVEFFTQTMEMEGTTSVTFVDNADPDNPSAYSITESEGMTIETVVVDGKSYTRMDEGEWEEMGETTNDPGGEALQADYSEVELVDATARQFRVVMDLAGQSQEALITVDDQFRASVLELQLMDQTAISTFDYETRMDIPDVG